MSQLVIASELGYPSLNTYRLLGFVGLVAFSFIIPCSIMARFVLRYCYDRRPAAVICHLQSVIDASRGQGTLGLTRLKIDKLATAQFGLL